MATQLHLQGVIDPRPFCPLCKTHVDVLGQVYPVRPFYVCCACIERLGVDNSIFCQDADGKISTWVSTDEAEEQHLWRERGRAQAIITVLKRLCGGCVLSIDDVADDFHLPCGNRPQCPKCRRDAQYSASIRAQAQKMRANWGLVPPCPLEMPICKRCGQVHNHKTLSGASHDRCERCDAQLAVEAYYRQRAIFGENADDETILDRIYKVSPHLFESNILPDYWFELKGKQ